MTGKNVNSLFTILGTTDRVRRQNNILEYIPIFCWGSKFGVCRSRSRTLFRSRVKISHHLLQPLQSASRPSLGFSVLQVLLRDLLVD
ncbi:hypothetical protein HMPREF2659_09345 [Pseudomonas aeruginosa]|nr:hypothetical protein HMPREF2659_09345 [Pseudomonas aeruginosa]